MSEHAVGRQFQDLTVREIRYSPMPGATRNELRTAEQKVINSFNPNDEKVNGTTGRLLNGRNEISGGGRLAARDSLHFLYQGNMVGYVSNDRGTAEQLEVDAPVNESFFPYLTWDGIGFYTTGSDGVEPPPRDLILAAAKAGLVIRFDSDPKAPKFVELAEYEEILPVLVGIAVGEDIELRSARLLEGAYELREVYITEVDCVPDLRSLPNLRSVIVGPRLRSATENPNLLAVDYRDPKGDPPIIAASVESVTVTALNIEDLDWIQHPESLTKLDLESSKVLGLAGLERAVILTGLTVSRADLRGTSALLQLDALQDLFLHRVRGIDSVEWMSEIQVPNLIIRGNRVVDDDLRSALLIAHPSWEIDPKVRPRRAVEGPFSIETVNGRYGVTTTSWEWFDERMLAAGVEVGVDGYVLEDLAITLNLTTAAPLAFDSEGSMFYATAATLEDAETFRTIIQKFWNSNRSIRTYFGG